MGLERTSEQLEQGILSWDLRDIVHLTHKLEIEGISSRNLEHLGSNDLWARLLQNAGFQTQR